MRTVINESQKKYVTTHCEKDHEGKSQALYIMGAIMGGLPCLEQNHSEVS